MGYSEGKDLIQNVKDIYNVVDDLKEHSNSGIVFMDDESYIEPENRTPGTVYLRKIGEKVVNQSFFYGTLYTYALHRV